MQPFNTLSISQQEQHFVTFKMCVSSNGYVLGEIDHLHEGGGVGADLNDRGRGGVHHLQVKDKDGPSQLDKISMTGRFSSMQVELQEISV